MSDSFEPALEIAAMNASAVIVAAMIAKSQTFSIMTKTETDKVKQLTKELMVEFLVHAPNEADRVFTEVVSSK